MKTTLANVLTQNRFLLTAMIITVVAFASVIFLQVGNVHAQSCGDYIQGAGGTCTDNNGQQNNANVVLTANPSAIQQGNSSLLSWGPDDPTAKYPYDVCTIDHGVGDRGNGGMGSVSVTPSTTTTYGITCIHQYWFFVPCGNTNCGSLITDETNSSATVTVTQNPTLVASCSVAPSSIATGGSATWTATASGGNGTYTYSWSGSDTLSGSTAGVSKTYSTAGTKTGSVTVTSGTQTVTQACGNGLTVSDPSAPDLSTGSITPTSAIAGTALTLTATVSNGGTASTGTGFTDLFQRATDSSGTGATDIGTYASGALINGSSNTASKSYTFASAGTYYVRACADKSSAGDPGLIAESNETNNCGIWSAITVSPVVAATPTCNLTANPTSGVPSTLTWSSTDATSCTGGGFSTGGATSGSVSVGTAGSYTLSCSGTGGSCPVASVSIGGGVCTGAPTMTIDAAPTRVHTGQTSTISWTATNVPGASPVCTVSGPGVSPQTIPAGGTPTCAIPNGSATPTINIQSTYTITCAGVSKSVTVNIIPKFIEF